jgi:Na+/proline symporter
MVCVVTGYFVSNHAQTMKMFGVRSVWDMKMGALLAGALIAVGFLFGGTIGVLGRELFPGLEKADLIYPTLLKSILAPGLLGLVVAGLLAASISTFEGISAAMAALFTRDLYRRLLVRDASEQHYLGVTRLATLGVVLLSFLYVPLILNAKTMVDFFISITSVFVTPLTVVYLMGMFTRVHRHSGLVGLLVGVGYGIVRMTLNDQLPLWLSEKYVAYLWSAGITTVAMLGASLVMGWERTDQAAAESNREVCESPFGQRVPGWARPESWAMALVAGVLLVILLLLW